MTSNNNSSSAIAANQPSDTANATLVYENGTIMGAVMEYSHGNSDSNSNYNDNSTPAGNIPEIVISGSHHHNHNTLSSSHTNNDNALACANDAEDTAIESTALLAHPAAAQTAAAPAVADNTTVADALPHDEFEQFVLNRSTSDSNILESSIYSELQFPPSLGSGYIFSSGGSTTQQQLPATANANANAHELADLLNTSTCSRESTSRASKRSRRKYKAKTKWNAPTAAQESSSTYPPQYTAIFLEHGNVAANAMGQIASAAATSPFLNAPLTEAAYQQYQLISAPYAAVRHLHHRRLIDTQLPPLVDNINTPHGTTPLTTPASALAPVRSTFRKCFSRPVVPFVIGIFALGGAACTLGGVVLGATGLIEHTTQYLSASLLMIGIGLSLLIVSGIIWRLSSPSDADECPCYRLMETCRNCNSPYCNNRLLTGSYLYPEFQHRPPPPSYLTSLHECAAIGLLNGAVYSGLRMNTPPPLYRSTNSLSVFVPSTNNNTTTVTSPPIAPGINTNATNSVVQPMAFPSSNDILSEQNVLNINAVIENLQAQAQAQTQSQALTKEINYLELD